MEKSAEENQNPAPSHSRVTLSVLDLETATIQASKNNNNNNLLSRHRKYSHPNYDTTELVKQQQQSSASSAQSTSPPNTPQLSAKSPHRRKKHSLPNCATLPVPIINDPYEEGMKFIVARLKICLLVDNLID